MCGPDRAASVGEGVRRRGGGLRAHDGLPAQFNFLAKGGQESVHGAGAGASRGAGPCPATVRLGRATSGC